MAHNLTPRLPTGLSPRLLSYLLERDSTPPTNAPGIVSLTSTLLASGMRLDRLIWTYQQVYPDVGLQADGFVLSYEFGDTGRPQCIGMLLADDVRQFALMVPAGQVMSYGLTAFRLTHIGMRQTAMVVTSGFAGSGGDEPPGNLTGTMLTFRSSDDSYILPAPDGVATSFTFTAGTILLDPDGFPLAELMMNGASMWYSENNPPEPGRWHLDGQTIVLAEPPEGGDRVAFAWVFVA